MEEEGALDRREMSPLQRRAAATRRRIEAARAETAHHPKTQRGRMFAAPNAPPPSSPGNSPLTVLEDRRNGSPYNVGRTAVSGSGSGDPSSSSLATPSGINTRARMEIRQRARKIQLCTPMSAQWFRCGEHLKHLAEAATLEERAESETRTSSSSESVSTFGSDGNVPGSSPLSPAMLAEGIRSGRQSRPSHEKNSDDQSNKSLWDVDDQHVTRGILEEGKLNALLRLLAAHRQLLRQKRSESRNRTWDDFIDETCVATSLTRNELLHKVKRWEVNAGIVFKRAMRAVESAQVVDMPVLLRHVVAVLQSQDALWMEDEERASTEGGSTRGTRGGLQTATGDSNPRRYGACQETHVLHYLERILCAHLHALDEAALVKVAAETKLFPALVSFLDERGDSLEPDDLRAGLCACSGVIATESYASHRRHIVGGVAVQKHPETSGEFNGESSFTNSRVGIQSEELANDTDARIVRIGNRLARPLFSNVDPVRRRGVRALLDECARLERISRTGVPTGIQSRENQSGDCSNNNNPGTNRRASRPMSGRVIADRIKALSMG